MAETISSADAFGMSTPSITPDHWIEQHERAHSHFFGPRDTRIPTFLPRLTQAVCTLRFSLMQLRLAFDGRPEAFRAFRDSLLERKRGLHGNDPQGHLVGLLDNYLSRIDWREQDVLEMILEYLDSTPGVHEGDIHRELALFKDLRDGSRESYDRAVLGIISEARGSLIGLTYASRALRDEPKAFPRLSEEAVRLLAGSLARALGLSHGTWQAPNPLPAEAGQCWSQLYAEAREYWERQGTRLPLKPFEKASVYLLECLPITERQGHAGFVRYLIESTDAYRRMIATCYAALPVQRRVLAQEVERYNRLPEHSAHPVHYDDDEQKYFLYGFFLRPDAIEAIVERERRKDIYRVISGLGARAHLPRVLQEVHNIFGYVTPEAMQQIVEVLGLDPADVIRVISSYKQYSADPGGDIIIYVCKGTACFLRGQPELSRRLASEIQAQEGEVGRNSIQFIEMDCFGVCHLAPVIKAGGVFLGKQSAGDIPQMLERLLTGPEYENKMSFLNRIHQMLAPGHTSDLLEKLRISTIIDADGSPALFPEPASQDKPGAESRPSTLSGWSIRVDSECRVFAASHGAGQPLGRLASNSFAFTYRSSDTSERIGSVVLDEADQITSLVNFSAPTIDNELRRTLKPQARVSDGTVWVETADGPLALGPYAANVIAVERQDGGYRLILLTGAPSRIPPQKQAGVHREKLDVEDKVFAERQDRLVLGFAAGTDPEDIESYIAQGGYGALHRALGLAEEPTAWDGRRLVAEIGSARLRGRGGAGFPTGSKWEAVRLARCIVEDDDANKDEIKLIVANGDEGDPGAFMDRTLIQERPHQVIEGMVLAALAVGARYGVIYVRKEYEDAVRRLEHALFQARRKGFLGESILSVQDLHFDIDIRLGAGAFVAGEKRAIMRAIEGEPAEPTLSAVSNTFRGLWGKPTLLNNVETFANVPLIVQRNASWYAKQGTDRSGGSKIFSVAGIVRQTGLVEARFGRTLNDIIRICGGIQEGKQLAGVQIGGPSGAILSLTGVRTYILHTPLDFDTFESIGAMLGSGGLVFIGEDDDVVKLARHFTDWLSEESCGQCPPCLQGTVSLGRTLDMILQGEGTSQHIHALWAKSDAIKAGSQCGLGMTAANPVTSALRFFPHSFLHHLMGNSSIDRVECFRILESLRLLSRENIEKTVGRRRQKVGYSFVLKKHLVRHLAAQLETLDRYRPQSRRAEDFLDLIDIPAHEVGLRDATVECSLEQVAYFQHDSGGPISAAPTKRGLEGLHV